MPTNMARREYKELLSGFVVSLGNISNIMRILSVKPVPWLAVNLHHLHVIHDTIV